MSQTLLADIVVTESPFRLDRPLTPQENDPAETALIAALEHQGIVVPLVAWRDDQGRLTLVDGFRRFAWAKSKGLERVPVTFLPDEWRYVDVLLFAVACARNEVAGNFARSALFILDALERGISREEARDFLLPALGLPGDDRTFKKIERGAILPDVALCFAGEKKFSMKQVMALTRRSGGAVELVFSWRDRLALTASIAEELCERIDDIARSRGVNADEVVSDERVTATLQSSLPARERTELVRTAIARLRYPTLMKVNETIETAAKNALLPDGARLDWDRSLEKREVHLALTITKPGQIRGALDTLSNGKNALAIEKMLEEL